MRKSPPDSTRPDGAASRSDTASTEQVQGRLEPGTAPERRNERLPHERDESARATGRRQTENPTPSDRQISKAGEDVEAGRLDTERRGIPNDIPKQ